MFYRFMVCLVVLGMLGTGKISAQSWEHPTLLAYQSYAQYQSNTCLGNGNTIASMDGIPGPGYDMVYQLFNRRPGGMPDFESATLIVTPPGYQPDMEVYVCQYKVAVNANDCPIIADNTEQPGQPIELFIPSQYKAFHIIITSGNLTYTAYNLCENHTLQVYRS